MQKFVEFHILILVIASLLISTADAQEAPPDAPTLVEGTSLQGTITADDFAQTYIFSGLQDEIIAVEMRSVDRALNTKLYAPVLQLIASDGTLLVDTTPIVYTDDALLVARLPTTGQYTVIATRENGADGDSLGPYMLQLHRVHVLAPGTSINGTTTSEDLAQVYAVEPESLQSENGFSIYWQRTRGAFAPEVTVHRLNPERGGLERIAAAQGHGLSQITLGIFPSNEWMIILLQQARDDYYFETVYTDYQISIMVSP